MRLKIDFFAGTFRSIEFTMTEKYERVPDNEKTEILEQEICRYMNEQQIEGRTDWRPKRRDIFNRPDFNDQEGMNLLAIRDISAELT